MSAPLSPHPPSGLLGVTNRLRLPLSVQYVVLAPVVLVAALVGAVITAGEVIRAAYAAIGEMHRRAAAQRASPPSPDTETGGPDA